MLIGSSPDRAQFVELARQYNVIPVTAEMLADMDTPVSLMHRIYRQKGPTFLFESVEGGENWGRYSFIGASARCQLQVTADQVCIERGHGVEKIDHGGEPLAILRQFMSAFKPPQLSGLPRFWGGLVGYLTYETVSFIERIPNRLPTTTPLARFMLPDELLIFDNLRNTLMLVAIAFIEKDSNLDALYDDAHERILRLRQTITRQRPEPGTGAGIVTSHRPQAQLTPEDFRRRVQTVKEYIRAGDVIQTVISQTFQCPAPPDPLSLYRAQRYINPSPYLFFLHLGDTILVGSSPETMVRLENNIATLRPIAGTRPRGETEQADRSRADDLLKDEKERAEHLMLVDLGRNDLGRVAQTGSVQVTDLMVIERYSHVMHLVSNITCDLKPEFDAWDLFAATFPAGTLSGAPKVRAMEIIAELERSPRGPYGGAVGYVSFDGNMDMAITIRTACIQQDTLTVRAGAGIVADSDPERERIETVNKAEAIQRALQLVQQTAND